MQYKSKDFYLSSVLLAVGIPLLGVEQLNSKVSIFIFNTSETEVQEIIAQHWNRTLNVPTRDFVEAIHELKTRLYSGR